MAGMMNGFGQPIQPQQQAPAMGGMQVPPPMPTAVQYMVAVNGQQYGPYNIQQLKQMVQTGQLTQQTYVWKQGMAAWDIAGNQSDLVVLFAPSTPGAMPPPPPTM